MLRIDDLIIGFDKGLRTVFAQARSVRPVPGETLPEAELDAAQRAQASALMRVNHSGEICAQALYQGQAMTARDSGARAALEQAAREETEHLAWTERRINELGGRKSLLNPLWYAGSFAIGAAGCAYVAQTNTWTWNMTFKVVEPLLMSPWLFGNPKICPAIYGIQNLNFQFNIGNTNRVFSSALPYITNISLAAQDPF
jgi:demethoxyubiquinone hydroxylase (CLK1/Coq7/Cat5 family)